MLNMPAAIKNTTKLVASRRNRAVFIAHPLLFRVVGQLDGTWNSAESLPACVLTSSP